MSSLRIYTTKDLEVRTLSTEITVEELLSPKMQTFADDLIDAMIRFEGIGIAACQVGRPIQMIVVTKEFASTPDHLLLVNPRIVSTGNKKSRMEEGCLSVPGAFGPIDRETKVRVKALTRDGKPIDIKAKGMFARILQHEVDHLNAILFIDNAIHVNESDVPKSSINTK